MGTGEREPKWVVFSILQIYNRVSVSFSSPVLFVLRIRGEIEQVGRELEPGGGRRRSSGSTDLTLQFTCCVIEASLWASIGLGSGQIIF